MTKFSPNWRIKRSSEAETNPVLTVMCGVVGHSETVPPAFGNVRLIPGRTGYNTYQNETLPVSVALDQNEIYEDASGSKFESKGNQKLK